MKKEMTSLVVFAREPKKGKVKTRLQKDLSSNDVLRLYKAFIRDTLNVAKKVNCDMRSIYYAGSRSHPSFLRQFKKDFDLKRQMGKNLGDRMHRAFCNSWKQGVQKTVIIGSDCLTLSNKDLNKTFRLLSANDIVLGPTVDGGYYLIGLKKPCLALFRGIKWSSESVLSATLRKAKGLGKRIVLLSRKEDVDTVTGLKKVSKLLRKKPCRTYTQSVLKKIRL